MYFALFVRQSSKSRIEANPNRLANTLSRHKRGAGDGVGGLDEVGEGGCRQEPGLQGSAASQVFRAARILAVA